MADQFDPAESGVFKSSAAPQSGGGFDPNEFASFKASAPNVAGDVARSGGVGVAKGMIGLAGLPSDAADALNHGFASGMDYLDRGVKTAAGYITGALGTDPVSDKGLNDLIAPHAAQSPQNPKFGSADLQRRVEAITGPFYEPQTTAGRYAQTIGEFLPAVAGGPEGLLGRVATRAVIPGIASEAAGEATEGTAAEPYARGAAALAAGIVAPRAAARAVTPFPISPERQAAVQTLRNEGITDLSAGQITGKKGLRYFESEMGGNAAAQLMENQGEQFTAAALRRVGETANRATPDVIDRAFSRIGGEFDRLSSTHDVAVDVRMWNELQDASREYQMLTPPAMRSPLIENVVDNIGEAAVNNNGVLDGQTYQALRSRLDRAARSAKSDPQLSGALFDIRGSLDDAMERSMLAAGAPDDVAAWRAARRQYRNMMVIEKAATGAGENAAQGIISPSQLRAATVVQNRRGYARGQGDFSDLARAGEAVMKPLPDSGTAGRLAAHHIGTLGASIPAVLGGGAGAVAGGPLGAALGAAAGAVAPRVAGRIALSGPGRRILANQIAGGRAAPTVGTLPLVTAGNSASAAPLALPPPTADDRRQQQLAGRAQGGRVNPANIDANPTEAQKQAGNYAKDHVRIHGLDITIENAKGAQRKGVDRNGKPWSVKMPAAYGYIKRTRGADGDHVDVYLGPHRLAPKVYVVDQIDADSRKFDEHKAFIGFASKSQAINAYHKAFSDGRAGERFGHVTEMTVDEFRHWLDQGDTKQPLRYERKVAA